MLLLLFLSVIAEEGCFRKEGRVLFLKKGAKETGEGRGGDMIIVGYTDK